ncbi:MAG TPA: exonuclease domain-containing protein [Acidimicrobiales bacterium]|nr:exonuclease domain-containing protein [Acidimicrobiales bacterium]
MSSGPWCSVGQPVGWHDGELLGFDLETTGVDRFSDVPVSFALVTVVGGQVVDRRTSLVDPGRAIPEGATEVHGITTARARAEGMALADAVDLVAGALLAASRRGVPVVGMKLDYDLTMLDTQCRWLGGSGLFDRGFGGPVLDALVIDRRFDRYRKGRRRLVDLCDQYQVAIDHAHDAAADAEAAVRVLLALCGRFPRLCAMQPQDLHLAQGWWHRQWARSYDAWRREKAMTPLDPREEQWPIALPAPDPGLGPVDLPA